MTEREQIGITPASVGPWTLDQLVIALELSGHMPHVRDATPADMIDWQSNELTHVLEIGVSGLENPAQVIDAALARHYPGVMYGHKGFYNRE